MRYEPSRPDKLLTIGDTSCRIHGISLGPYVGSDHISLVLTVAHSYMKYLDRKPRLSTIKDFRATDWPSTVLRFPFFYPLSHSLPLPQLKPIHCLR